MECSHDQKRPVAGYHDSREGFILSGNQLVYDPLYSESVTQANRVKQFLNASVAGIENSCDSSQFTIRKSKSRTQYKPSLEFYKTYSPVSKSNREVKQIFTNKLQKGVAVNPLYTGVLENAFKAKKSSTGSEEFSKTLKSSVNLSFHERSMSRVTNNGLASILDLMTPEEELEIKSAKKPAYVKGRKSSLGSVEGRKLKKQGNKKRIVEISKIPEKKIEIKVKQEDLLQDQQDARKE